MILIDANVFLQYLIFSKHIDSLKCKEVKEAVEMSKVDVFDKIIAEIEQTVDEEQKHDEKLASLRYAIKIINKYRGEEDEKINITNNEAIEILLDMANELQIIPESKQGQALQIALNNLKG